MRLTVRLTHVDWIRADKSLNDAVRGPRNDVERTDMASLSVRPGATAKRGLFCYNSFRIARLSQIRYNYATAVDIVHKMLVSSPCLQ